MSIIVANNIVQSTNNFLSSLGVNTHSGFESTVYNNASLVIRSLDYLGINQVRDNLATTGTGAAAIDALAQAGVKFAFVASSGIPAKGEQGLKDYIQALADFRIKYGDSISFVEGLNEVNIQSLSTSENWASTAVAFQKALYEGIKGNATLANLGVANLSIGMENLADYAKIGDLSAYSDYANSHAYAPVSGAMDTVIARSMANATLASSNDPIIITETGYNTYHSDDGLGVSATAQAKLTLTALLNSWENGSSKTFLYELLEDPQAATAGREREAHFGLFQSDGTPKLAATAIHNLTSILNYGVTDTAQASSSFSINTTSKDTHVSALGKGGGVYDLLVWRDAAVWNAATKTDVEPANADVMIDLGKIHETVYVYDPLKGTTPVAIYHNISQLVVPIGGSPLIVEVGASSAVTDTSVKIDGALVMTAEYLVANVNSIAKSLGDATIMIDGDNVFKVASLATMHDLQSSYANVLSKINGNYSFQVTNTGTNWRKETNYSASGDTLYTKNYNYAGGVLLNDATVYADGTRLESVYVSGKLSYSAIKGIDGSIITTKYDATSGLVASTVLRSADGSTTNQIFSNGVISQLTQTQSDGSRSVTTYVASGAVSQIQSVDAANNWTTQTFDSATGALKSVGIAYADKSSDNWSYGISGQSYISQHQVADKNGVVTLVERFAAGDLLVYRSATNADGSRLTSIYNGSGKLTEETATAANGDFKRTVMSYNPAGALLQKQVSDKAGNWTTTAYDAGTGAVKSLATVAPDKSSETWSYGITGQNYVSQHQLVDKNGIVTLVERFAAGNLLAYRSATNTDGSRLTSIYNSGGKLTEETVTAANGDYQRTVQTYDPAGALIQKQVSDKAGNWTTTAYDAGTGAVKSIGTVASDKSADNWSFGITGQNYVSQHQIADKNGVVTLVERFANANLLVYRSATNADGSRLTSIYNGSGKLTEETATAANGDFKRTVMSYDPAGALIQKQVSDKAGNWATTTYDAGTGAVKSIGTVASDKSADNWSFGITGQNYVSQHQATDKNGVVVLVERFAAGDILVYRSADNADGSRLTSLFNGSGKLTEETATAANGDFKRSVLSYDDNGALVQKQVLDKTGLVSTSTYDIETGALTTHSLALTNKSREVWSYGIQGEDYVSQVQTLDGKGAVTSIERFATGDKLVYRSIFNADGSNLVSTFDAHGRNVSETFRTAGGVTTSTMFTYDASGQLTQKQVSDASGIFTATQYDPATGVVKSVSKTAADASREDWTYGVTGENFTSQRQITNSQGVVTLIEKFAANNKAVYRWTVADDGTALTTLSDGNGRKSNEIAITPGGVVTRTAFAYNAAGKLTQVQSSDSVGNWTTKVYDPATGALKAMSKVAADKSIDYVGYGITGQNYTSVHQLTDAKGVVTLTERFTAANVLVFSAKVAADGSKLTTTYDSGGRRTQTLLAATDGSNTATLFDAASGKKLQAFTTFADGHTRNDIYANNVLIKSDELWAGGARVSRTYAASGATTQYQTVDSHGDWRTAAYDATGALKSSYVSYADKRYENLTTGITGQSYTTQHLVLDATGKTQSTERWNGSGGWNYRSSAFADGSSIAFNYDAQGRLTTGTKALADGTSATRTFDVSTGAVKLETVRYADGHSISAGYTGGVVTTIAKVATDGTRTTEYYDLAGHRTQQTIVTADNSWFNTSYDAGTGAVTKASITRADGSGEYYNANITGQNYSVQRQVADVGNQVTLLQRWDANGTKVSEEQLNADGSRSYRSYNATGSLAGETIVALDGTRTFTRPVSEILGAALGLHYGVNPFASTEFGAVHDLLDMSKLNAGYSPTIALQIAMQTVNPDLAYATLTTGGGSLLAA